MMKQISLSKAKGQVFKGSIDSWNAEILLSFETGFVILCAEKGYDDDVNLEEGEADLLSDFNDEELIEAGVISREELEAERKKRDAASTARREAYERDQLAKLTAKYGA